MSKKDDNAAWSSKITDVPEGWIYVCDDGTHARQVVIQKLKNGEVRLLCPHTGGKAKAMSDKFLAQVQRMIDEGKLDWSKVTENGD